MRQKRLILWTFKLNFHKRKLNFFFILFRCVQYDKSHYSKNNTIVNKRKINERNACRNKR